MLNITQKLLKLSNSNKTVFSTADLMIFWEIGNKNVLKTTISRAIKNGYLKSLRRGLYALGEKEIDVFELAGKLKKCSYVSFETVLAQAGVIFQWYDEVFSASNRSSIVENEYGKFKYRKLPDRILADRIGITNKENCFIATPERALCDKIYKDGMSYFDELSELDKNKLKKISEIYNERVINDIKKICS